MNIRHLVLSYWRSSNLLSHTYFSEKQPHKKMRWCSSPHISVIVGQLKVLPYWVLGVRVLGFFALEEGECSSTEQCHEIYLPVQLFSQLAQQWRVALKSSLPRGSLWPAHSPKFQGVKSQGPDWALTWANEAGCLWSGGQEQGKFLLWVSFRMRISDMSIETQHAQFLSILWSSIAMHLETLHNCSTFIYLTENRITRLLWK